MDRRIVYTKATRDSGSREESTLYQLILITPSWDSQRFVKTILFVATYHGYLDTGITE